MHLSQMLHLGDSGQPGSWQNEQQLCGPAKKFTAAIEVAVESDDNAWAKFIYKPSLQSQAGKMAVPSTL